MNAVSAYTVQTHLHVKIHIDCHVDMFQSGSQIPTPPAQITLLQMDVETLKDGHDLNNAIVDFFVM